MLCVHRVHNKNGVFDIMLDSQVDIADCRTLRVNYNQANDVMVGLFIERREQCEHKLIIGDPPAGHEMII